MLDGELMIGGKVKYSSSSWNLCLLIFLIAITSAKKNNQIHTFMSQKKISELESILSHMLTFSYLAHYVCNVQHFILASMC